MDHSVVCGLAGIGTWTNLETNLVLNNEFPCNNLAFPVEMFVAVMEQKHKFGKQSEENIVMDALSTISEPDNYKQYDNISLWKQENFSR